MLKKGLFLGLFFIAITPILCQSFSKDRDKFAKEWLKIVQTDTDRNFCQNELKDFLENPKIIDFKFNKLVDDCNLLLEKQFSIYPDCFNFLTSSVYQELNSFKPSFNSDWNEILFETLNGNQEKQIEFLNFSSLFFKNKTIYSEENFSWYFESFGFNWVKGKKILLECLQGNLVCRVYLSGKTATDSIKVYQTNGTFDLFNNNWTGNGGEINWEKVNINKEETFAKLRVYKFNLQSQSISVDTVELTTPYFDNPILGRLKDKTISDLSEGESSPQFTSYEKRLKINDLRQNIDYDGEFSLVGDKFIGSGTDLKPAKVLLKFNNKVLFELSSTNFQMNPKQIISRNVHLKMNYPNGDSLSIDNAFFNLDEVSREISVTAPQKANIYAPFFDSYYKLYVYAPKLIWKLETVTPYYTFEVGTTQEQKVAKFQSSNYFDAALFDKFRGVSSIHPFTLISKKCKELKIMVFKEADFASILRKTVDQVKPEIVDMAADGFLSYNSNSKQVFILQKLIDFADANGGLIDFDNILILSDLRKNKNEDPFFNEYNNEVKVKILSEIEIINERKQKSFIYASIHLDKNYLRINEVNELLLSRAQKTIIFPDSTFILMEKNRDIRFSGWLHAGKFEIHTNDSKFKYDEFKVDIKNSDEAFLRVKPIRKEDGSEYIKMQSSISNVKGDLFIDDPLLKSGKQLNNSKYPFLKTFGDCFVYYDSKEIEKGAYDRERFYYKLESFEMDSLDNFNETSFVLSGELTSAGIFPKLNEKLVIMNDYSFGFISSTPPEGYNFYNGKTKFTNKIALSNNGLQGSGIINFLNSTSISKKLTFLPDSTYGLAQFINEESTEYPYVESDLVQIIYQPKNQILQVESYLTYPLLMFHGEVNMQGILKLDEQKLAGIGTVSFENAVLSSSYFSFKKEDILSDNTTFSLLNRFSTNNENPYALTSNNFKAFISLRNRVGDFESLSLARIKFPVNKFYCKMDEFKWKMDNDIVEFVNKTDRTTVNNDSETNNFFSLDEKQDSLQFNSQTAKFDLKLQTIFCDKVEFIKIADALIFPDNKILNIRESAVIDPLVNSKILVSYINKYHNFISSNIQIKSRNFYEGFATYPYYDRDSILTLLPMTRISCENLTSIAVGDISEKVKFKLSKEFDYFGKINISSLNPGIILVGAARLNHTCGYDKSWIQFADTVLAKNIQIPIAENPINSNGEKMAIGFLWHDNEDVDSLTIYPAFISKKRGENDIHLFNTNGYIQFNQKFNEFQIAVKSRLAKVDTLSNILSLQLNTCELIGEGQIDLGINLGDVKIESFGKIKFDQKINKTLLFLNTKISIPFPTSLSERISNKIKLNEELSSLDFKIYDEPFRKTLVKWTSRDQEDLLIDYAEGKLRRMPSKLNNTFILSGLVLESFSEKNSIENSYKNGLISKNQKIGIVSINGDPIFKMVPFQMFFEQTYSRNSKQGFLWNIELENQNNYFFNYLMEDRKQGEMLVCTDDSGYAKIITDIKPAKRNDKNFKFDIMKEENTIKLKSEFKNKFLYK